MGITGKCMCGGVSYVVSGEARDVINCHCERCRRITGHFMAATAALVDELELTSDTTLQWFHPVDDPNVGYGFCNHCGSTLFWKVADSETWSITAGTVDQPSGLRTDSALFVAEAGDYHTLDESLPSFERERTNR